MRLRFVLYLLSMWFLVRFVVAYVVPLVRTGLRGTDGPTRVRADGEGERRSASPGDVGKAGGGDYLDYEEVR